MRLPALFGLAALVLSGCAAATNDTPTRAVISETALPPMKVFATPAPQLLRMSNIDLARDFMDLHFKLESGRELKSFTPLALQTSAPPEG